MVKSTAVKSFEEVYKTSYSHGLENIYALETVDIKTVRPFKESEKKNFESRPRSVSNKHASQSCEASFDFGIAFEGKIEAYVLREPIQVLGLTRYIENALLSQEKKLLKDLVHLKSLSLGRGHLDEIQQRLSDYLNGRHLQKTNRIDFASWLKTIVGSLDRKKTYLLLEPYDLENLFPLTTSESLELRRLTLEKKMEWVEEAENLLRTKLVKEALNADWIELSQAFLKPWMRWRHGLATESELLECLDVLAEGDFSSAHVLGFLKNFFEGSVFPFHRSLMSPELGVFASSRHVCDDYLLVINEALSYFYQSSITYSFNELVSYLEKGFAKKWIGFQPGFVAKVLKISPNFYVYKNPQGILHVSIA